MRVFLLDNTDSFTYNLAQAFLKLGAAVQVRRAVDNSPERCRTLFVEEAVAWQPTHVVLSPGPLRPDDHPANFALLDRCAGRLPILGVCLGMQAINAWCDGTLRRDTPPVHGKTSRVHYAPGAPLLDGLPNPFVAARYHSLVVDQLGKGLRATAWTEVTDDRRPTTDDRITMALAHTHWPLYGVQFHPESYLSPEGEQLLRHFLCVGA